MAFPATRMNVKIELAVGADRTLDPSVWTWTDISNYWRPNSLIQLTAGRPDQGSVADPQQCTFVLDNSDGRFVRTNPYGAYFPSLNKNTPVRISIDYGTGFVSWFQGDIPNWAPRWDISGKDKYVTITAAGAFRRLQQWKKIMRSPAYRWLGSTKRTLYNGNVIAYWPLEDPEGSSEANSAVDGVPAMRPYGFSRFSTLSGVPLPPAGFPAFGAGVGTPGSDKVISLTDGGLLQATIPTRPKTYSWNLVFIARFPNKPSGYLSFSGDIMQVKCENSSVVNYHIAVQQYLGQPAIFLTLDSPTALSFSSLVLAFNPFDGAPHMYRFRAYQSGADIVYRIEVDDNNGGSATATGLTLGEINQVVINPDELNGSLMPTALGHVCINSANSYTVADSQSIFGWDGETAQDRIKRLCPEENVKYTDVAGYASEPMGPQGMTTFFEQLRDCEAADGGLLIEYLNGVLYYPRKYRENRSSNMQLSMTGGDLSDAPEPIEDDSNTLNDVSFKTVNGSEQRYINAASVQATDTYSKTGTINVQSDNQALRRAQWEVNLGTFEGLRYPAIHVDLAAAPGKITQWMVMRQLNLAIALNNPPPEVGPSQILLYEEGYTETIGWFDWNVELNCSPGKPYKVGVIERAGGQYARADFAVPMFNAAAYTSSDTALVLTTPAGQPIIDSAMSLAGTSLHLECSTGEIVLVTAISGATSPQTFTVTRASNFVSKAIPINSTFNIGYASMAAM